jgi:TPR repeat protein
MYYLGLLLSEGDHGVPQDEGAAVRWLRQAAQAGSADAARVLRQSGIGVVTPGEAL